jgi:hypothetical protein
MHRSKEQLYSITSSARASSVGAIEAEHLCCLEVDHQLELDGACTGRSEGFSPL